MKKKVLSIVLISAFVLLCTAISAFALTIDKDWTFSEDFEGRNGVTYNCNTYGGVAFVRKTDEANGYGTGGGFIEARTDQTCKIERSDAQNHTPDVDADAGEGRALRISNISSSASANVFIANTYFYGNPSTQPSGSGVFGVGYDGTTSKTYFYNNAKYYEEEFFMLFPAASAEGEPDGFGSGNITFQWNLKTYNPDNPEKDNDNYTIMMQIVDKKLYGSNTTYIKDMAVDTWYDVKFAVDFEKNQAYAYVDGELIYTYEPSTQLKSVRRLYVTIPKYCTFYMDDLTMNPFGGAGADEINEENDVEIIDAGGESVYSDYLDGDNVVVMMPAGDIDPATQKVTVGGTELYYVASRGCFVGIVPAYDDEKALKADIEIADGASDTIIYGKNPAGNPDKPINAADFAIAKKLALKKIANPTAKQLLSFDVGGGAMNGCINTEDFVAVKKVALQKEDGLEINK